MPEAEVTEQRNEIARRIQAGRFACKGRHQPCQCCRSTVFDGCMALAEAVLTPIVEFEQGGLLG